MKQFLKKIVISVLSLEARLILWKYKPRIVVVTGSVGKTSAKEAIHTALKGHLFTRKSEKSYNSEFGVPLTVIGAKSQWNRVFGWLSIMVQGLWEFLWPVSYPKVLVLEVGADRPGDLRKLFSWLPQPEVVVATRFPDVAPHVVFFKSPDHLFDEESFPVNKILDNGALIINSDDKRALSLEEKTRAKVIKFGLTPSADVFSIKDEILYSEKDGRKTLSGISFEINVLDGENVIKSNVSLSGVCGITHIYPVLAGISVAKHFGAKISEAVKAFEKHEAPRGRMNIVSGIKGSTLIDDTYNSSPSAAREALLTLKRIDTAGRKIAVLGDMGELGDFSKEEHQKVGQLAKGIVDVLVCVGDIARDIAEGALNCGMDELNIQQFENSKDAGKYVESILKEGDLCLFKASQYIRMEKVVEEVMAHPEWKENLLVRQDAEWRRM